MTVIYIIFYICKHVALNLKFYIRFVSSGSFFCIRYMMWFHWGDFNMKRKMNLGGEKKLFVFLYSCDQFLVNHGITCVILCAFVKSNCNKTKSCSSTEQKYVQCDNIYIHLDKRRQMCSMLHRRQNTGLKRHRGSEETVTIHPFKPCELPNSCTYFL